MYKITVDDIINIHDSIYDYAVIKHGIKDLHLIDSAIGAAFQTFNSIDIYDDIGKAVRLGLGIAKNHGFVDGNKRTGCLIILTLLKSLGHNVDKLENSIADKILEAVESSEDWSLLVNNFIGYVKDTLEVYEMLNEKKKNRRKKYQVNPCAGNVEKNVDFFNLVMSGDTSNDSSLFASDGSFVGGESLTTEDYIKQANDLYEKEHELKENKVRGGK